MYPCFAGCYSMVQAWVYLESRQLAWPSDQSDKEKSGSVSQPLNKLPIYFDRNSTYPMGHQFMRLAP
ncbi:hypothetical protein BDZ97DRAFT_1776864 [Flammula alnicola]|nr:hypothetical protein BDZ97DRAFT_1776864 [Flammula alnicola]